MNNFNLPLNFLIFISFWLIGHSLAQIDPSILKTAKARGPFTWHFNEWLKANNYGIYKFDSPDFGHQASFGGKQFHGEEIRKRPVIFIHGNSDGALSAGEEEWAQGWSASISHLLANGYSTSELYAVTYGDRNFTNTLKRTVDCETLIRLRRFLESVLQYTGAQKVDIVSHSMGVTLARQIIQGRGIEDLSADEDLEQCYLGPSLRQKVHTFIGISGANYGICICSDEKLAETAPACSKKTGFWAGSGCPNAPIDECHLTSPASSRSHCHSNGRYSATLKRLNMPTRPKDAHYVVSIWSDGDAVLGKTNFAWGRQTSLIPNSDHSAIYSNLSHYSIKWKTVEDQLEFLSNEQKNEENNEEK
uniref:Lipase n=2 Tax=Meloidogyne incognita group TaxID=654580 RepID=A0A915MXD4_MELJA